MPLILKKKDFTGVYVQFLIASFFVLVPLILQPPGQVLVLFLLHAFGSEILPALGKTGHLFGQGLDLHVVGDNQRYQFCFVEASVIL